MTTGGFDPFAPGDGFDDDFEASATGADVEVEILGPHLRVGGTVNVGRFRRLSDMVNQSLGYLRMVDARLLRRNGDPTGLVLAELLVSRDEITFIGRARATAESQQPAELPGFEHPGVARVARRLVIFTPGHTITGDAFLYGETTMAAFLESPDPRFVALTNVRARSLADRRVISHFDLLLVNKTQMIAAAEANRAGAVAD